MNTEVLGPEQVEEAASLLHIGEIVAIPTETVYGLAASIFDETAIQRVFIAKGRPSDNPLIAHISRLSMLEQIAVDIPPRAFDLIEQFWPGPLTLVLSKKEGISSLVSAGHTTIAVRMPAHPIARKIIDLLGYPLVAPSANLSGRPSPTTVLHVLEDLDGAIRAVVDGGSCALGIESTVVSLVGEFPVILRPGSIRLESIEQVLKVPVMRSGSSSPVLAPGMKYRHYAPKAPIRLIDNAFDARSSFLISKDPIAHFVHRPLDAQNLYRHLRDADRLGVETIDVLLDPQSMRDEALMNRLEKAACLEVLL